MKKFDVCIYTDTLRNVSGVNVAESHLIQLFVSAGLSVCYVYNSKARNWRDWTERVLCDVTMIKNGDQNVECRTLIISSILNSPKRIKADRKYTVLHTDVKEWNLRVGSAKDEDMKFIAVSEQARKAFEEKYDREAEVISNIFFHVPEPHEQAIRLGAFTRINKGKGIPEFMKLIRGLEDYMAVEQVDIYAAIFGESYGAMRRLVDEEICKIHPPVMNHEVGQVMKNFDAIVQLSPNEGFCYTAYEAVMANRVILVPQKANWTGPICRLSPRVVEVDISGDQIPLIDLARVVHTIKVAASRQLGHPVKKLHDDNSRAQAKWLSIV